MAGGGVQKYLINARIGECPRAYPFSNYVQVSHIVKLLTDIRYIIGEQKVLVRSTL